MPFELPTAQFDSLTAAIKGHLDSSVKHSGDSCDLFGTMGSLFDESVKAVTDAAEKAVSGISTIMGNIGEMITGIQSQLSTLIDKAIKKFNDLSAQAIVAINNAIQSVTDSVNSAITTMSTAVKGMMDGIASTMNGLKDTIAGLIGDISAAACKTVNDAVSALGGDASPSIANVKSFASTGALSPELGSIAKNAAQGALDTAKSATSGLGNIKDDISKAITPHLASIEGLL